MRTAHLLYASAGVMMMTLGALASANGVLAAGPSSTHRGGTAASAGVAPQAVVTTSLGGLVSSVSKTDAATLTTTSGAFVDIPGATVSVTVPGGAKRGFHVTLSGTCAIDGAGAEEDVLVRVLVNGAEIAPGATTYCEDFSDNAHIPEGGHALQWVKGKVGPGNYTIKAQWATDAGATGFLRDMNFTVRVHN